MQTAKNLFLWPGRSTIRKGIEIGMALVLGQAWSKRRTLEVYLNIAEWGHGIFGAEAAAQTYFHKSAAELDAREATLLATSLPNPVKRDPAKPAPSPAPPRCRGHGEGWGEGELTACCCRGEVHGQPDGAASWPIQMVVK